MYRLWFCFENENDIIFKKSLTNKIIFTDEDRSENIKIFDKNENNQLCRYCAFYIVNPFTQYCSIHKKKSKQQIVVINLRSHPLKK